MAAAATSPSAAHAFSAATDGSYEAQLYTVESPFGDPVLRRRRHTVTLGTHLFDLGGAPSPGAPRLEFAARFRADSDMGISAAETAPTSTDSVVPGVESAPLDLMYAYLDGSNYLGGYLDFRLGRQYTIDALGWWSFDGAKVQLSTPAHFALELLAGFEQREGNGWLSTSRFEADGVYRGSRHGFEDAQWPQYLDDSALAPAYGVALETRDLDWLQARLGYRRVTTRSSVSASPLLPPDGDSAHVDETRISSERLGTSLNLSDEDLGIVAGTGTYDLYTSQVARATLEASWFASESVSVGGALDRTVPVFDADSIFNSFSSEPSTTLSARMSWSPTRRLTLAPSGGVKHFGAEERYSETEPLGSLSASFRKGSTALAASASGQGGARGHQAGSSVSLTNAFASGFYEATLIASLYDWEDELRPSRSATSVSYVLGFALHPFESTTLRTQFEHTKNRLVGDRFRGTLQLEVAVLR